jgi:hypothetical protein
MSAHAGFRPTHEEDRVSRAVIARSCIAGAVFVAICLCVTFALLQVFTVGAVPPPAPSRQAEIGPVEQTPIRETERGLDLVREQRRSLDRWGWVDRSRGVAQIPIDRAIDLVVADGGT